MTAAAYVPREHGGPDLRGNSSDRRRRREWLIEEWRANVDALEARSWAFPDRVEFVAAPLGTGEPACRCYRCGALLTVDTLTVDRVELGKRGGRYTRDNIRPACEHCNKSTGARAAHDNNDDGRPW